MQKIMFNDRYGLTDAVLRGRKTQTRRLMKSNGVIAFRGLGYTRYEIAGEHLRAWNDDKKEFIVDNLRYKVGEVVAVAMSYKDAGYKRGTYRDEDKYIPIFVNGEPTSVAAAGWGNKMFVAAEYMPHHICVTGVKIERLQDISDSDIKAEGVDYVNGYSESYFFGFGVKTEKRWIRLGNTPREAYAALIDRVSGKGTWENNPFVVVYEFKLID